MSGEVSGEVSGQASGQMSVDVVLPVYNGAEFVTRALDSVIVQEPHPALGDWDLRIHIINDASKDESAAILADYATRASNSAEHLSITTLESNGRSANARNLGITIGSAKYVAFIDQDDQWEADKLVRQIGALEADASLGYAVGKQQLRIQPGQARPAWCRPEWLIEPVAGFLPSALVVRRDTFATVGMFDTSVISGGDDVDWFARARALGIPCHDDPACVVHRYAHESNTSGDIDTSNQAMLDVVRRHIARKAAP
jgi:glycosyltransferase involved in cell wall biosynthesis